MRSFNHFGVYGICVNDGKLLVIRKGRGPYAGRFDLPGGRLEENESLLEGLVREFMEETGLPVTVERNLGTFDWFVRYQEDTFTHMHHIAALYIVGIADDTVASGITKFAEQDSLGTEWVELPAITLDSASPVTLAAAAWVKGGCLPREAGFYDDWEVENWPST